MIGSNIDVVNTGCNKKIKLNAEGCVKPAPTKPTRSFEGGKHFYEVIKYFNDRTCLCRSYKTDMCYVVKMGNKNQEPILKESLMTELFSTGRCTVTGCGAKPHIMMEKEDRYRSDGYLEGNTVENSKNLELTAHTVDITKDEFDFTSVPTFVEAFGDGSDRAYYVTEYVGYDMYDFVDGMDCIPEPLIKSIIRKLLVTFRDLHALGVAHCDLSLENVCITVDNNYSPDTVQLKLLDFGISVVHPQSKLYLMYKHNDNGNSFNIEHIDNLTSVCDVSTNNKLPLNGSLVCSISAGSKQIGRLGMMSYERRRAHMSVVDSEKKYCAYKDDVYAVGVMMYNMFTRRIFINKYTSLAEHRDVIDQQLWLIDDQYVIKTVASNQALDFLHNILAFENKRKHAYELLQHCWLN